MDDIKKKRVEKATKNLMGIVANLTVSADAKVEILEAVINLINAMGD